MMVRQFPWFPVVLIALLLLLLPVVPVSATTYTYTNATLPSSVEFQAAINATTDGDTIALAPGIYWINKSLLVFNDTTIQSDGGTAQNTILDGLTPSGQSPTDGIFHGSFDVNLDGKTLTIKDLTLRNSQSSNAQGGGGVNFNGNITVISSDFFNVSTDANRKGGALACGSSSNGANITVTGSNFAWCSARQGGAIYSQNSFVIVNSSSFVSCSAGAIPAGGAIYANAGGNFTFNRFDNITAPDGSIIINNNGAGVAIENWYGTNNPAASMFPGLVTYTPYLKMGLIASPSTITTAQTSTITANLTYDSDGTQPSPNLLPDGIPVFFTVGSGPGSIPAASVPSSGHAASSTLTPSGAGTVQVNASTSGYNVSVLVNVSAAPTPVPTPVPTAVPTQPQDVRHSSTGFTGTAQILPASTKSVSSPPGQVTPSLTSPTPLPSVPVPTQTTVAPAFPPAPPSPFPTMMVFLIALIILVLIIVGYLIRRWWIRRQNPALFRKLE